MERKLLYMQGEMMKDNIDIPPLEVEPQALPLNEMKSLENLLEKWEGEVQDLSDNQVALLKNYLELSEMYYVLTHIGNLLGDTELTSESLFGKSSAGDGASGLLTVMCGVVQRSRCFPFEMMLWRVSRGNIYYRQAADDAFLQDPQTGTELRKVAFLAVFQGEALNSRMEKVCNGFRVNIYSCPETIDERMDMLHKLDVRIGDLEKEEMESNVPSFISKTETSRTPPTYHRTNKFTRGFQALINAYGDSTYGELNPGLYTVITFPFLFSVMFGDVCHGLILVAFGAWMVTSEKKFLSKPSTNEIWNIFFGGRYVILLMGLFTLFTGFLYNEYFSKPITLMMPYWKNTYSREEIEQNQYITLNPVFETNSPYIFGVDPIWKFIPQMLFLCGLFLWLVILMYMKWYLYSGKTTDLKTGAGCAPLILILFIDMVLGSTSKPVEDDCDAYMFEGQEGLQSILVLVSLLCVPILLFGSPVYLNRYNRKMKEEAMKKISNFRKYQRIDSDKREEQLILDEIEKYSTTFGELMIQQAVHTIEFVLSTISHTASYLRLWALSLAHEQLSEMLWVMILAKLALRDTTSMGPVKLFFIFAVWAVFTLSILVIMEGLSAFLHTLRLHWVEFMSKFYSGGGYPFKPFNFRSILSADAKDDKPEGICKKRPKTEY
ncbi:unnamed protein product [Pieris brassicae]|uniref:V-type proton ATPase subunit a n=1 Tax=Pieris brassicae TaxID=7116 RepID=A0A9P0TZU5_PIEBR|nr:unnamed protein product [Pieris brassicae]